MFINVPPDYNDPTKKEQREYYRLLNEQKKEIKELGTYNTVKVIPDLVVGNVFKDGDKMKIWVSDDANKVPLLIESPLKIGSAKAVLKSYKGLRYKLSSKIE